MTSDLLGTSVAWESPWANIEAVGLGIIRGVYPDAREGRVARVIIQIETIEPVGAGGAEVGDLIDVNLMCVRVIR